MTTRSGRRAPLGYRPPVPEAIAWPKRGEKFLSRFRESFYTEIWVDQSAGEGQFRISRREYGERRSKDKPGY